MSFSLRILRHFVATAEQGSITGAARQLNISQPSVSAAIGQLERVLEVQLFLRKPARGMMLTPAGKHLLREARVLLDHADEFRAIAQTLGHELRGELRAACFINLAPAYFADLIRQFSARYPGISINFRDGHHEEVLTGIRTGRFEVALTFDLSELDEFDVDVLAEVPACAVLSKNHPLASEKQVSLVELASQPLILMDLPYTRDYFLSLFYSLNLSPNIKYRTTSFEMVRTLAGNNLGYAVLNLIPKSQTTYDGTRVRTIAFREPVRPLFIVSIRLKRMPARRICRAFVDFAKAYFADGRKEIPARPISMRIE